MSGGHFKISLVVIDSLLMMAGFFMAGQILDKFTGSGMGWNIHSFSSIVLIVFSVFVFYLYDLYAEWNRKRVRNLIYSIVLSMAIISAVEWFISTWTPLLFEQGMFVLASFVIQTLLFIFVRSFIWYMHRKVYGMKKVLIIGTDSNTSISLAGKILNHTKGWFEVLGFIPLSKKGILHEYIKKCDLFLLSPSISREEQEEIVAFCTKHGKEVLIIPQLLELSIISSDIQQIDDTLVLSIKPLGLSKSQMIWKRMSDCLIAFILLVISSPLFLVLSLFIPLTSKGPALYKQERIGMNGRPYMIYKFRSMVRDAEKATGPVLAADKDPRITPIGRFIRATRLDELPQLINVLKGDMSLVGPRPEREYFIQQFKQQLPEYSCRLTVKPGITGLAQVLSGYTTSVNDKLRYDLLYIRNYSLWLDVKILFQTVRIVFQREHAQGVKTDSIHNQNLLNSLEQNKAAN